MINIAFDTIKIVLHKPLVFEVNESEFERE